MNTQNIPQKKSPQKLARAAMMRDSSQIALMQHVDDLEEKVDAALAEIKETDIQKATKIATNFLKDIKGEQGNVGLSPTEDELVKIIKPLIPKPIPGNDGKDYKLTDSDKKEIAKKIKVPVVEKIIEKTEIIREQPIVTEVALLETAENLRNKLESLKGEDRFDIESVKGYERFIDTPALNRAIEILDKRTQYLINKRSGGINSVVAGNNVTIDTTDPFNPIINATGSGTSPLTTKGDVWGYSNTNARIPVGGDGTVLTADSTQTLGVKWASVSGSGITRSVNSISSPATAGATAKTDYVYLVSGTTTLTLPTAVGNTNLYSVKNIGTNTVTIATTSAQTIDGSSTVTLPVKYTSLDLISDGSNWNII